MTTDDSLFRGAGDNFKPLDAKECANPKCDRLFTPRAEGDDYCSERCDPLNKLGTKREGEHD
jgi:hypothetical protein